MRDHPSPVVLVHGAWHGPWCWERVTPLLDGAGVRWQALDLPTMRDDIDHRTSVHCDAAVLRDALDALDEPGVVVGHSYGGVVITEGAAGHPNARHLVYLAAFIPDAGEHLGQLMAQAPNIELAAAFRAGADGRIELVQELVGPVLYGDCNDATIAWATGHLRTWLSETTEPVRAAAWRAIPSTYVVCAEDRVILPGLQRTMARRASRVIEWQTSHSPFASQPRLLADLLISLAREP